MQHCQPCTYFSKYVYKMRLRRVIHVITKPARKDNSKIIRYPTFEYTSLPPVDMYIGSRQTSRHSSSWELPHTRDHRTEPAWLHAGVRIGAMGARVGGTDGPKSSLNDKLTQCQWINFSSNLASNFKSHWVQSLGPWGIWSFKLFLAIDGWHISCKIALWWMLIDLAGNKSHTAPGLVLPDNQLLPEQCWPKYTSPYMKHRSKKTSEFRATSLSAGNSVVTCEIPRKMASNAENLFIWWRHHVADDGSTLLHLLAWYRRAATLYLSQR